MTISKQLSPVGYLNKMTGHIWTPTEQPNAADEPGLYEPLVLSREVLEKFIAIQAERDALAAENVALKEATDGHYYWEDGGDGPEEPESFASNGEMEVGEEFELVTGVEIGYTRFRVLNNEHDIEILSAPLQTPATDAVIANTQAGALDVFANAAEEELAKGKDKADVVDTGFNLGVEAMISMLRMSANALRAGRKG